MRGIFSFLLLLLLCCSSLAQQSSGPAPPKTAAATNADQMVIKGCLSGDAEEGYFLGTDTGDLYQVIAKSSWLQRYRAKTVSITGTVASRKPSWSPSRVLKTLPPIVRPTKISKVYDSCD